jgi:hypothetical protein
VRVSVQVEDARNAWGRIKLTFPGSRVLDLPDVGPGPGRLVIETVLGETQDAAGVLRALSDAQISGVHSVTLDEGKNGLAA